MIILYLPPGETSDQFLKYENIYVYSLIRAEQMFSLIDRISVKQTGVQAASLRINCDIRGRRREVCVPV